MSENAKLLGSYKISTSHQDILSVMIRSTEENLSILWQTSERDRTVFPVTSVEVNIALKRVVLNISPEASLLDMSLPVYVKLSFRETVFKGKLVQVKPGQVTAHLPTEVHWRDFREVGRINFKVNEHFIIARPYKAHLRADQLPTFKIVLKDISERGMGLVISSENAAFFKKENLIEVVSLDNEVLPRPMLATVRWVKPSTKKEEKLQKLDWLIGMMMLEPLPSVALDVFSNGGRFHRNVMEHLTDHSDILDPKFQELLKTEVAKTLKKMKNRPAISKYLQQLEIAREKDSYLSEHIDVLAVVCTFLARALGWVSDASMEKFVYAAYMHDAPLFGHPRLAVIKNKQELESYKSQLTEEELKIYLNSPMEALRLIEADTAAPPDVGQMVVTQKEMPDGSGFPQGMMHSKISPMSSLFIIAHSLTDEIMQKPNWQLSEWLEMAKVKYKGGHFNKILQALETVKITFKNQK